jgi:hypothetical protein
MKYNDMTFGQMEAVINKLGGMDGVQRLLSGELVVTEPTPPQAASLELRQWTVWRTLKLGTGIKTAADFRKALKTADCNIGDWGNNILGQPAFTVADKEIEVELVIASGADLGFKGSATRADIYKRAQELGLDRCPAEVGPQLRLQYTDQPNGEWLLIAMEPIAGSDGDLVVFRVGRRGGGTRWLNGDYGGPVSVCRADDRWVFLRRK